MDYMPQGIANPFYLYPITADDILIEIKILSIINLRDMISLGVIFFSYVQKYLPLICLNYTTGEFITANIPKNWELPD